jgi:hypothetical protein
MHIGTTWEFRALFEGIDRFSSSIPDHHDDDYGGGA